MEFLELNEASEWAEQRGLRCRGAFKLALTPIQTASQTKYAEGRRSGREGAAARDLLARLGNWDECLVWIKGWGVWPSGEDWPKFYAWRGALGERRSLDKAPAHRFDRNEQVPLEQLLTFVMENAWDADVLCSHDGRADGVRAFISHDEWYQVG